MGKGGGASASLVDPSAAMASYQKGADVIEKQFPIALQQFLTQSNLGLQQQLDQYGKATAATAPYSATAKDSMNELRFYLGMPKLSDSLGLSDEMSAVSQGSQAWAFNGVGRVPQITQDLATQMSLAERLTDPGERAAAKQNILAKIDNVTNAMQNDLISYANATKWSTGKNVDRSVIPVATMQGDYSVDKGLEGEYGFQGLSAGHKAEDYGYNSYLPTDIKGPVTQLGYFGNTLVQDGAGNKTSDPANWEKIQGVQTSLRDEVSKLQDLKARFGATYSTEVNTAPTADQIMQKLSSTPDYQVNLKQGEQTVSRSQAAKGILNSGNAAIEMQQFGADFATNAYQRQISNLANLAGIAMPATQQGIQNSMQQGNTMLGQYTLNGQTMQQSVQDIARSRESAFIRSGDAQLQAAMMNAQLKTQASMQNAAQGASSMAGIGQLAGSVLGMIL